MATDSVAPDPVAPRGSRLGLPADGPGSLAPLGARLGAFIADALASALVAGLFTAPAPPNNWSLLVFFCEYVFCTATFGQTPGMWLARIEVIRLEMVRIGPAGPDDGTPSTGAGPVGLARAALRTVLLMLLVPTLIWDRDRRGLHDRLTDTAITRVRKLTHLS